MFCRRYSSWWPRGQTSSRLEFEVASVKAVDSSKLDNPIQMNIGTVRHEQVTFGTATLNDCIRFAYDIASDVHIAGADWIKSTQFLYDVVAKALRVHRASSFRV